MGKLLAWGDALFVVRYEIGKLQIQRITVGLEQKKVSLRFCSIKDDGVATLPVDAHLVAAKEVEDTELAIRFPVLVFHAPRKNDTGLAVDRPSTSRKRRRSTKDKGTVVLDDESTQPAAGDRLFFCILYETENDGEIGCRILNMLENPSRRGSSDEASGHDSDSLQYFLMDGPFLLLFQLYSQAAIVLKLQRATQEGGDFGFHVWLEKVDVVRGMGRDVSAPFELVSCVYVSETHCTRPHLLIHARESSSGDSENHIWSILDLDYQGQDGVCTETSPCHYLHLSTGFNQVITTTVQITCCCFISELSEWDFTAPTIGETAAIPSWDNVPSTTPSSRADVRVSTLVVTGTTNNTTYVHENGILVASYVLPTQPAEIWLLSEDSLNQHHVLCVRCDDEKRSFFMLGFSSIVQTVSMDLLLSFSHVGHAYTGIFAGIHTVEALASHQVLLLNDVPGIIDAGTYSIENKLGADKSWDDEQLVKRSVLVTQKPSASDVKLSCHRLRLRDNKSKHSSRSRKRSRNNEKNGGKSDPPHSKPESFHYIERTQKASSRHVNQSDGETDGDGSPSVFAASQSQLGKLVSSLSTRLRNGLLELERLQLIVGDKYSLARQLNQLIVRQWQKQQTRPSRSKDHSLLTSLISSQEVGNILSKSEALVEMETLVSAPPSVSIIPRGDAKDEAMEHELKLAQRVSLDQFRVLEYVPSSSLIYAEVFLKNLSDLSLDDTFVALTAPRGGSAQSWRCSCSVVPEFHPVTNMADHTAGRVRFQLEIQFSPTFSFLRERNPLEMMLWLHWGASQAEMALDWRPGESALAVAPVKIHPCEVLDVGGETRTEGVWTKDQEQLLFISSGSNLSSLLSNPSFGISTSADSIIRPTFSLVDINVKSRELMLYELSRMVANIPPDVYVMRNPLQLAHLSALQNVLRSMRKEILASQQGKFQEKLVDNYTTLRKLGRKTKDQSIHQRDTELHTIRLLQELQKRVNFHTMWFDSTHDMRN